MNYLFAGLGQYNKAIQYIFKKLCVFNQELAGGWFDLQEKIFIRELAVVIKLNKFNRLLVKLLLIDEKEFLLTDSYRLKVDKEENNPSGFTRFANSDTFIIPNSLNFIKYKEL